MTAVAGPVAAAGVAGALSHALFFRRVDVDTRPFALLGVFGGAHVALAWALCRGNASSTRPAHAAALLLEAAFLAALCASLLTYRAFLHPLRHFPGPFGARLSKFWAVRQTLRSGLRWYLVDAALHGRYGDYVRTGEEPRPEMTGERLLSCASRPARAVDHRPRRARSHPGIRVQDAEGAVLRQLGGLGQHHHQQGPPQAEAEAVGHLHEAA